MRHSWSPHDAPLRLGAMISLPCFNVARNATEKCASCNKKIAKGSPRYRFEAPPGNKDLLHDSCLPKWIADVAWPGGMAAFAREVVENSWEPLPEEITSAAGPLLPAVVDGAFAEALFGKDVTAKSIVAFVQAHRLNGDQASSALGRVLELGDLAEVRELLAVRRWPASRLSPGTRAAVQRGGAFARALTEAVDPRERAPHAKATLYELIREPAGDALRDELMAELARVEGATDADILAALASRPGATELIDRARRAVSPAEQAARFFLDARRRSASIAPNVRALEMLLEGLDLAATNEDGLNPVHAVALGGLSGLVERMASDVARPLPRDATMSVVTHGPVEAGIGPDGQPYYEERYVRLVLRAGWTAIDVADAALQHIIAARTAWAANPHASADGRARAEASLALWQTDLEATLGMLRRLGAIAPS